MLRGDISRSANDALSINFMIVRRLRCSVILFPTVVVPRRTPPHRYVIAITSVLLTPNQHSALQGRSTNSRPDGTVILFSPRRSQGWKDAGYAWLIPVFRLYIRRFENMKNLLELDTCSKSER